MSIRDFGLFAMVCFLWALNTVISKIMVTDYAIPPLFYGAVRFAIVALAVLPWMLPAPRPLWRIALIGMLMGAAPFGLTFIGLVTASPSAAAIVSQVGIPVTTILSVLVLGEVIHWRRGLGIAMALVGVLLVLWRPGDMAASAGLLFIVGAAVTSSIGAILMKQMEGIRPLRFQAWVGLTSIPPLALMSVLLEPKAGAVALKAGWPFLAAVSFSALVSSVIGHTVYYVMIQRYEANLISPLTLMAPLFTIGLGVIVTGDHIDLPMVVGTTIALAGVLTIVLRRNHVAPLLLLMRLRG
jgi:O-acetylserine/cysteine efflux transporter